MIPPVPPAAVIHRASSIKLVSPLDAVLLEKELTSKKPLSFFFMLLGSALDERVMLF